MYLNTTKNNQKNLKEKLIIINLIIIIKHYYYYNYNYINLIQGQIFHSLYLFLSVVFYYDSFSFDNY